MTMNGNKEGGLKCLLIEGQALQSVDRTPAPKLLNKARRLDPPLPARKPRSAAAPPPSPTTKARASPKGYTEEQAAIIQQIMKQTDYYRILGLERSCAVADVRSAYRRVALKVHPDKNKAPGAEDAFKAVSRAFQCLSNDETRKRYDLAGSDEPNYRRNQEQEFDAEFDADEIFRDFFYDCDLEAKTPYGTFRFSIEGATNVPLWLQILPIIVKLLLDLLASPDFAVTKCGVKVRRRTDGSGDCC